jgi:hypothetical protein
MTKLKNQYKKLRFIMILFTVMQINYGVFYFLNQDITELQSEYVSRVNFVFIWFCILYYVYVIWFVWNKMPIEKNRKHNLTLLILFLGIIGVLIWDNSDKKVT